MTHSVIIHLEVRFYLYHPTILHLCNLLQLEVSQSATIQLDFDYVIAVSSVEMAFLKAILDGQKLQLSWVPSSLCVL